MEKQKTTLYKQLTNEPANTFLFWALIIFGLAGYGFHIFGKLAGWDDTDSPLYIGWGCSFIEAVNVGATYFSERKREARK